MFSYEEVIHLNTQCTTLNLYTNLSVVKEEIAFIQASKKKMKKIEQSKGSVQGSLCICILFQAFVASSYNRFTFLNKQDLEFKNNKIFITFTIINIQVCFIKNYFFLGKTLSNNHQCVIPYKDFLISIKQHRLCLKEPNFLPVSSDALINIKKYIKCDSILHRLVHIITFDRLS